MKEKKLIDGDHRFGGRRKPLVLTDELVPKLEQLMALLDREDPVMRQQLIELLMVQHALSAGDDKADFVLFHMHRHAKQLRKSVSEGE